MDIRIRGLVAAVNQFRRRLQAMSSEAERTRLACEIRSAAEWVERTCRESGVTPADLPGPSRTAYVALRELEKSAMTPGSALPGSTAAASPPVRVKNLVAGANWLADHLWNQLSRISAEERARREVAERIRMMTAETRALCSRNGAHPADLVEPSRSAYAWMAFLDGGGFGEHVEALVRARSVLPPDCRVGGLPLVLHLRATSVLWKLRRYSNCLLVTCSEGFLAADEEFWRRFLGAFSLNASDVAASLARDLAAGEEFGAVMLDMEAYVEPPDGGGRTAGVVRDLAASFERVNREHYGGTMERPVLTWSRSATVRTLGLYMSARDRVVISQSLDDASVPEFVLDYVMYHELLHKKLGIVRSGGRNHAHTPEFRALERAFPLYAEAQTHIEALVRRLRA
jgi:hypothetical protein